MYTTKILTSHATRPFFTRSLLYVVDPSGPFFSCNMAGFVRPFFGCFLQDRSVLPWQADDYEKWSCIYQIKVQMMWYIIAILLEHIHWRGEGLNTIPAHCDHSYI